MHFCIGVCMSGEWYSESNYINLCILYIYLSFSVCPEGEGGSQRGQLYILEREPLTSSWRQGSGERVCHLSQHIVQVVPQKERETASRWDRIRYQVSATGAAGVFTDEQEKDIWWYLKQAWVIIMSQTGKRCFIKEHVNMREKTGNREGEDRIRPKHIMMIVFFFLCISAGHSLPWAVERDMAGGDWFSGFMKIYQLLSLSWTSSFNRVNVGKIFDNLCKVLEKHEFSPQTFWTLMRRA